MAELNGRAENIGLAPEPLAGRTAVSGFVHIQKLQRVLCRSGN